jgi:two-component system, NarL family, sensor histidine kinase DesK
VTHDRTATRGSARFSWRAVYGGGVFLVFLWPAALAIFKHVPSLSAWVALAALTSFVTAFVVLLAMTSARRHLEGVLPAVAWSAFGLAMTALMIPVAHDDALITFAFIAALAVSILPTVGAVVNVVILLAIVSVLGWLLPGWSTSGIDLGIVLAAISVWAFRRQSIAREHELAAERELAELAVDRERSRIGQDLHDILGHSLTVISLKSELAERLLDADPERARQEISQITTLARDGLAEVRATTRALQGRSLSTEIAAARQALDAAGIDADLPTTTEDVPSEQRELFAWAVREAVTNVIRHSGARHCAITVTPGMLDIVDDGCGAGEADVSGSGLAGLHQRATQVGAVLATGPGDDGVGFRLRVEVRP